jgi:multiple sugar transport system substrate-binding protein
MKRMYKWLSLLLVFAFVITACAAPNNNLEEPPPPVDEPAPVEDPTPMDEADPDAEPTPVDEPDPDEEPAPVDEAEDVSFLFWAAPNPPQESFWSQMARLYMDEHPNVSITVAAMPETPTSEAGIQAAIAGGTAPAISENIATGFGGTLYRADAIVPLNQMEGWDDLLEARQMSDSIEGWNFDDDNYYILPVYSNAMLFGWRVDILQELGYDGIPQTYSDITGELAQALATADRETFFWARGALTDPTWWERWFDFFMLYNAASGGQPIITGDEFTADDDAAITVLTFLQELAEQNLILTTEAQDPYETGLSVAATIGPWTFSFWREQFPELEYEETFALSMPPRPDDVAEEDVRTFADAKGLVIYAQVPEVQQRAAWDFVRWVFSNPEHDLLWMETTTLPPVRDDLSTNEAFQAFFDDNPELVPYAENIPNAVPPLDHPEFTEIQRLLGEEAQIPVINGQKDPETGWNDFKTAVESQILGQQ